MNVILDAKSAFAKHELVGISEGRWLIGSPGRSEYMTEVICLHGGSLYVGGDIDHCIFSYGPKDYVERVRWMSKGKGPDDSYFMEKASIGMGGMDMVTRYDHDRAICELDEFAGNLEDPGVGRDILQSVLHRCDTKESLIEALWDYELFSDFLIDCQGGLGMVPRTGLYFVHAALQKLSDLITNESQ